MGSTRADPYECHERGRVGTGRPGTSGSRTARPQESSVDPAPRAGTDTHRVHNTSVVFRGKEKTGYLSIGLVYQDLVTRTFRRDDLVRDSAPTPMSPLVCLVRDGSASCVRGPLQSTCLMFHCRLIPPQRPPWFSRLLFHPVVPSATSGSPRSTHPPRRLSSKDSVSSDTFPTRSPLGPPTPATLDHPVSLPRPHPSNLPTRPGPDPRIPGLLKPEVRGRHVPLLKLPTF